MATKPVKYIFVTGGVISGLGKGIAAASLAKLLKSRGYRVNMQKCDPYLNVDSGTLNPKEHGECFVTYDGAETDLDLGHYERFIDQELNKNSSVMSGRVLLEVIKDERAGKYEGDDVQIIPHLTKAIQNYFIEAGKGFDIQIVEIGGTVGDYESLSFIESIREFSLRVGRENCLYVHLVYLPFLNTSHEIKTKPAQNSLRDLRSIGIFPDILIARSDRVAPLAIKKKLMLFSGLSKEAIVFLPDSKNIYEVPLTIEESGVMNIVVNHFNLEHNLPDLKDWQKLIHQINQPLKYKLKVAVVAKYLDNSDTYISVMEAIKAAAWNNKAHIDIKMIDASLYDQVEGLDDLSRQLNQFDGVIVPGGFGIRGLEGKIKAAQCCLVSKKPYLGLCLGLQVAVIGAARLAGLKQATTFELDSQSKYKVITTMDGQKDKIMTGGTMRLGNYDCYLDKNSLSYSLYHQEIITERHRHRGECNRQYLDQYDLWGIKIAGINLDHNLVEIIEAKDHPFFIASQFHPEFKSRPNRPHPLFDGFIKALINQS